MSDDGEPEALNTKALAIVNRVRDKLTGRDFATDEPIDVPKQVELLIQQATSHENLCQCYIGWCPFWWLQTHSSLTIVFFFVVTFRLQRVVHWFFSLITSRRILLLIRPISKHSSFSLRLCLTPVTFMKFSLNCEWRSNYFSNHLMHFRFSRFSSEWFWKKKKITPPFYSNILARIFIEYISRFRRVLRVWI